MADSWAHHPRLHLLYLFGSAVAILSTGYHIWLLETEAGIAADAAHLQAEEHHHCVEIFLRTMASQNGSATYDEQNYFSACMWDATERQRDHDPHLFEQRRGTVLGLAGGGLLALFSKALAVWQLRERV